MDDIDDAISSLINAQDEMQRVADNHSMHDWLNPIYEDVSRALRILRKIKDERTH